MAREKETYREALALYFEKNERVNGGKAVLNKCELGRLFGLSRDTIAQKFDFGRSREISVPEAVRQLVLM